MKVLTCPNIQYAHMGELIIRDDICYTTFLQNSGSDSEELSSPTSEVVLAIFSLERALADDFKAENDVTYHKIGSFGDTFAGYKSISTFKCTSMCMVGDLIYIIFNFKCEDGRYRVFRVIWDIKAKKFRGETPVKIKYKDTLYDLTDGTLNWLYEDRGLKRSTDIVVEVVSHWNHYNGEYYTTFLIGGSPNNGVLIKTADFATFVFVDMLPNNELGTAEATSYIYKDVLYVACRQAYFHPQMVLNAYDLKTKKWRDPGYIEDGTSRPWFFEKNGDLYLVNSTEECHRRYANISKFLFKPEWEEPGRLLPGVAIETVATLYDCGFYFAITEYKGRLFFLATRGVMWFGELKLTEYDANHINRKLVEMLGE